MLRRGLVVLGIAAAVAAAFLAGRGQLSTWAAARRAQPRMG